MTDEPPPQPGPVPSEAEEAVVTPVELDEQDQTSEQVTRVVIKDAAAAQALAAPRTPVTEPYDPAPVREEMRNWISKGVLLSAAAAGLGVILNGAFGGSRGLGLAAAEALVADGARVVLSSPHEATASAAAARLAEKAASADSVTWVVADNSDPTTPDRLIAAAKDRFGRLDGALGGLRRGRSRPLATTRGARRSKASFLAPCGWLAFSRKT